jgi:hypothetical protein
MKYEEAEKYIEHNRNRIDYNLADYKYMVPIIASNTAETRAKEMRFKGAMERGISDDAVLRNSSGVYSDLNVFLVYESLNGLLGTIPFSDYLEIISQR